MRHASRLVQGIDTIRDFRFIIGKQQSTLYCLHVIDYLHDLSLKARSRFGFEESNIKTINDLNTSAFNKIM